MRGDLLMDILSFLLQAGALIAAVFCLWNMIGVLNLRKGYSFGRGFIAVMFLFFAEILIGKSIFSFEWRAGWLFFLSWVSIFPVLEIYSAKGSQGLNFSHLTSYIELSCAGMVLLTLFSNMGSFAGVNEQFFMWIVFIILLISGFISTAYLLYYWVYGKAFSEGDMLPILQTYQSEAVEYIRDQIGWKKLIIMSALFVIYLILTQSIIFSGGGKSIVRETEFTGYGVIVLLIVCIYFLYHYGKRCFPIKDYITAKEYLKSEMKIMKDHSEAVKKIILDKSPNTEGNETIILVIGESACRTHMKAFNDKYPEETTPWLSKNKEEDGFYLFKNAYSNFPQTSLALSMYLTNKNQYMSTENDPVVTIIDIARKGGYKTYWLSNQAKMGEFSFFGTFVASTADQTEWTKIPTDDDGQLLDLLKKIPKEGKKFIALNIMGSHRMYKNRVPKEFIKKTGKKNHSKTEWYDTTILYSDYILQSIYEYSKQYLKLRAMIYCSDHGENMQYGHTTAHFTFDMVQVPMFIYLSEEYRKIHKDRKKNLQEHRNAIFTNDLMFDTLCGIMNLPNNFYNKRYDLSDEKYDLPLEVAVTNHGKTKISEDELLNMQKYEK